MASDYSPETIAKLSQFFTKSGLYRPLRVGRHEPGEELRYSIRGLIPAVGAAITLAVEKFVGGGFAGQVYKVRVKDIDAPDGPIPGLDPGGVYAMKILIPPSGRSRVFRDFIYALGFQSPFQLQVNPDAIVAGGLWQKFIRRAVAGRLGDERAVVDVLATLVDPVLGSCGEISEWVEGRTWRFEVDDNLLARWSWKPGRDDEGLGSPEYCAKRQFMSDIVDTFHEVGAPELARQYEWWTCKSQPNALKRLDSGDTPDNGLTAVDFRAGLALLPVIPMSPGDIKLIVKGLFRGSLVQFDRGNTQRLRDYVMLHSDQFAGMEEALERLIEHDRRYRAVSYTHLTLPTN